MKHILILIPLIALGIGLGFGAPFVSEAAQATAAGQVRLVESNAQHVVIEVTAPTLDQKLIHVNGTDYLQLGADQWGHTDEVGKPVLPMYGTVIAVPQNAQLTVHILQDKTRQVVLKNPVLPAPTARTSFNPDEQLPKFEGLDYVPDAATYASAKLYPADVVWNSAATPWRSQRIVRVQLRAFQLDPATRMLTIHDKLRVEISFGVSANSAQAQLGSSVDEGGFETALKNGLLNYDSARNWRTAQRPAPKLAGVESAASASDAYKISVNSDGIYQVTCGDLKSAGLAYNSFTLDKLHLTFMGTEVAIQVSNAKCNADTDIAFLFFGVAPTDYTVPANVYWLTVGTTAGKRMVQRNNTGGSVPTFYTRTQHLEQNLSYATFAPWVENADHYYWKRVNYPTASTDVTFALNDLADGQTTGTVRALVQSGADENPAGTMHATLYANGNNVSETDWELGSSLLISGTTTSLTAGTNTVTIQDLRYVDTGYLVYLNYVEMDYPAKFQAANDALRFKYGSNGPSKNWQYQITGFTNNSLTAFDITDPSNVAQLTVTTTSQSGGTYTGRVSDASSSQHEYIVLAPTQYQTHPPIVKDTPSSLRSPANIADYILITYGPWQSSVQRLATQRQALGRVKVVDVQDIYDEFNYGMRSPQAIHDFLAYTYANWQSPKPSYVLLFGDGNIDNGGGEQVYIPVYMKLVDHYIGMTASDSLLAALDPGSDLPSMAIGRLPALSKDDVNNITDKLLAYENATPHGDWQKKVLFVSDNAYDSSGNIDGAGDFFGYSEKVAGDTTLVPPLVADRDYFNPCDGSTYPQCQLPAGWSYPTLSQVNDAVTNGISDGRLIVNYVGHGSTNTWGSGTGTNILGTQNLDATDRSANDPKYPFMMPMTCFDGFFQTGGSDSLSEALVRQAQGGAIGSFAPAGLGLTSGHDFLDRGFFQAVVNGGKLRIGAATIQAKLYLYANDTNQQNLYLPNTYNLLGDPGTLLAISQDAVHTPTPTVTNTPSASPTPNKTMTATPTATSVSGPTATPTLTPLPSCATGPNKPQPVSPLNASTSGKARVLLTWNGDPCTAQYQVKVKLRTKNGPRAQKGTTTLTQFQTKTLAPATYFWKVQACNAAGCTASGWWQFTVK